MGVAVSTGAPTVSLLLLTTSTTARRDIAVTVNSVKEQDLQDWELLLVADPRGDTDGEDADDRIRTFGADQMAEAVDACQGTYLALLSGGDVLERHALSEAVDNLARVPGATVLYTDEDRPLADGQPGRERLRKPDWSPERERHGDVLGRLCLMSTETVRAVGGWNAGAGTAAEFDLVLRVTERGGRVLHQPKVQCHRGAASESSLAADLDARAAIARHLARVGIAADVKAGPVPGVARIERNLDPRVQVSVVIPTRWQEAEIAGRTQCLPVEAIRTMLAHTQHRALEFVVVYDEPVPGGALETLRELLGDRFVAVPYRKPFNFSEKCNLGFLHATGDVIVLANDDLQAYSERWVESLVAPALEPDVGLVGTKLVFDDGTIQHGGHLHVRNVTTVIPGLAYRNVPPHTVTPFQSLHVNREASGVTGACMALRRDVFEDVGGLCEDLPGSYNDVDLSLKVDAIGLRILWLAEPALIHFESKSREPAVRDDERDCVLERWGAFLGDPFLPWLDRGSVGLPGNLAR